MTEKMHPAGTTDGTIQRLEAKIARLERRVEDIKRDLEFAHSKGLMEGMRVAQR